MFDTEKFIYEIEKRPAIYNNKMKEYSNRELKLNLWNDIAAEMYENWNDMTTEEKKPFEKELQTKWRSIRDHFRKEVNQINKIPSGRSGSTKKRYIYFEQLQFLIPVFEGRERSSIVAAAFPGTTYYESCEGKSSVEGFQTTPPRKQKRQMPNKQEKEVAKLTNTRDESVEVQRQTVLDKNGNKAFLMSLLPIMNKIREENLIDARMQIMRVFQNIANQNVAQGLQHNLTSMLKPVYTVSENERGEESSGNVALFSELKLEDPVGSGNGVPEAAGPAVDPLRFDAPLSDEAQSKHDLSATAPGHDLSATSPEHDLSATSPEHDLAARWANRVAALKSGQGVLARKFIENILCEAETGALCETSLKINNRAASQKRRRSSSDQGAAITPVLRSPEMTVGHSSGVKDNCLRMSDGIPTSLHQANPHLLNSPDTLSHSATPCSYSSESLSHSVAFDGKPSQIDDSNPALSQEPKREIEDADFDYICIKEETFGDEQL